MFLFIPFVFFFFRRCWLKMLHGGIFKKRFGKRSSLPKIRLILAIRKSPSNVWRNSFARQSKRKRWIVWFRDLNLLWPFFCPPKKGCSVGSFWSSVGLFAGSEEGFLCCDRRSLSPAVVLGRNRSKASLQAVGARKAAFIHGSIQLHSSKLHYFLQRKGRKYPPPTRHEKVNQNEHGFRCLKMMCFQVQRGWSSFWKWRHVRASSGALQVPSSSRGGNAGSMRRKEEKENFSQPK